ncbi:uncharacterized protein LOC127242302 [Andrographis paniculata]|uniref:uncharacterized protein LOC127242302 n=1 Tax=Andrographis paniculata TaxID=175694 RepID=UPI0021E8622A|nr:uncharacterized protein LOC127242302 [Andrographis paniculata]XP_051117745.1 uncharacterized protein LOC127242302 [Andrographis paniculata]
MELDDRYRNRRRNLHRTATPSNFNGGGGAGNNEEDIRRRRSEEEDEKKNKIKKKKKKKKKKEDHVECTWKSCTAGAIADCVAVCCCPCGVVSILVLAFVKLPWAVARRCIGGRRIRSRRRLEAGAGNRREEDTDGIPELGRAETGNPESVEDAENLNYQISPEMDQEWIELQVEFGHWGFGRLSFTGIPFQEKGN